METSITPSATIQDLRKANIDFLDKLDKYGISNRLVLDLDPEHLIDNLKVSIVNYVESKRNIENIIREIEDKYNLTKLGIEDVNA